MATEFAARGDPREALAWTNRLLFLRATDSRIHVAAAQALLRLGSPSQALAEYKAAWALGDSSSLSSGLELARREHAWDRVLLTTRGHLSSAWSVLKVRRLDSDAQALLDTALLFPPSDEVLTEAQALRARIEAESGDPGRAASLIDALPAQERETTELRLVRVRLLLRTGRKEEALKDLERLHAREPANLGLGLELAGALSAQGKHQAAAEVVNRLKPFVATSAARSMLFQREGELWAAQERWTRAIDAYRTASRIEPTRADLHYRLAELFERMGSFGSALDELRSGRALDTPEGAKAHDAWSKRLEGALR
jgi:tetratricopeptide (TPR) repeat protein